MSRGPAALLARACSAAALLLLCAATARGAVLFDPALRFRRLPTAHFVVYFHQGEETLAQRLAAIAEETWIALRQPLGVQPPRLTHVVMADQTEIANGYATPIPYNTIVVNPAWPAGSEFIGDTDDWLRLVFTHEFTHVVHLDRSEGWARVARRIFGRQLLTMPNLLLPTWQIEGLATYEESRITGGGRLHAGDFAAIVRESARAGRLAPLDRVNGGLTDWPHGLAAYAYGVGFHEFLAEKYGDETLGQLAEATAGRVQFTASRVFKGIYGESLGDLWRDYEASLAAPTVVAPAPSVVAASPSPPVVAPGVSAPSAVASGSSAPSVVASGFSRTSEAVTRLTRHGFDTTGPRFCGPDCLVYSVRTPHGFPTLNRMALDGGGDTTLTRRFLGSTVGVGREVIYFDQHEARRNVGLYSDLYALNRTTGSVTRLTDGQRLLDPDLSPDEQAIAAVQDRPGQRDLVLVRLKPDATTASASDVASDFSRTRAASRPTPVRLKPDATTASVRLKPDATPVSVRLKPDATPASASDPATASASDVASPTDVASDFSRTRAASDVASDFSRTRATTVLISEPETQFNTPRWSPDGRTIAAERHRLGGRSEIVLVDVATKAVRVLAAEPGARVVNPAWRPDGGAVVAAMARADETFNLYEFPLDGGTPRQLTHTTGGATWPDISADGRTIVFVGYTVDGFDLFSMPYSTGDASPQSGLSTEARSAKVEGAKADRSADAHQQLATAGYSPLPTLKPTSWSPIVETDTNVLRLGAGLSGYDVLGYHFYFANATWRVAEPAATPTSGADKLDWQLYYAYDRWRPTWWVSAETSTSFFAGAPTADGVATDGVVREHELAGGVALPIRRIRVAHQAQLSAVRSIDDFTLPDRDFSRNRTAARAAWATSTAHTWGYSISPEGGVTGGATAEAVRRAFGSSGNANTFTADLRGYLPGLDRHHVVALRAAGGASTGDNTMRRTFLLGGSAPNLSVIDTGSDAISLLRGFPANTFAGSHVALLNAEYRLPLARPQRGAGTWPVFLHTVHASLFADAGHAWTRRFSASAIKTSVGLELSANVVAGYFFPFTITAGAARGHDGSGAVGDRTTAYVRIGRAF